MRQQLAFLKKVGGMIVVNIMEMDTKNIILMISQLTMLLKGNNEKLQSVSGGHPMPKQVMAFQVYHQHVEQLIRNLLDYLAKTDSSLSDLINYRIFEMELEMLLDDARISS